MKNILKSVNHMLPPQWRVSRMISNTLSLAQSVHSVKLLYIRILFSHLYWCLFLAHLWLNTSYLLWSSVFPSSVVFMSIISFFNVANLLHLSLFIYLFQQLFSFATSWGHNLIFFLLSDLFFCVSTCPGPKFSFRTMQWQW